MTAFNLSQEQLADEIKASMGIDGDAVLYSSSASSDALATVQLGVNNGVRDVLGRWGAAISLPMLLWAAEKAYYFALSRLPLPVPADIAAAGWETLKYGIMQLHAQFATGS